MVSTNIREGTDEAQSYNVYTHVVFVKSETYKAVICRQSFDNFSIK